MPPAKNANWKHDVAAIECLATERVIDRFQVLVLLSQTSTWSGLEIPPAKMAYWLTPVPAKKETVYTIEY
jgi:hypothetical protein